MQTWLLIFVVNISCRSIVVLHYLHNERNECVGENISALIIVAPELEQVQEFLAKTAFIMESSEELQQPGSCLGSHLGNGFFI